MVHAKRFSKKKTRQNLKFTFYNVINIPRDGVCSASLGAHSPLSTMYLIIGLDELYFYKL